MSEPASAASVAERAMNDMLASLGIPSSDGFDADIASSIDLWRFARRYVTRELAESTWMRWNPDRAGTWEDEAFADAFTKFLGDGVELGFRLERFRLASREFPRSTSDQSGWIGAFETAVGAADAIRLRLFLAKDAYRVYKRETSLDDAAAGTWKEMLRLMRDGLFYELGLTLPAITVEAEDSLTESQFRWEWNDLRLPIQRGLPADRVLVNDTPERLTLLNIVGEATINPANGSASALVQASYKDICERAGLTTWDSRGYIVLVVSAAIRKTAAAFVTRPLVDLYLLRLQEFDPELIELIDETFDRNRLVVILRQLVCEEISIRNMSALLQNLLQAQTPFVVPDLSRFIVFAMTDVLPVTHDVPFGKVSTEEHVEVLRNSFQRYITHKYTRGGNTLTVWLLDPAIEGRLRQPAPLEATERQALHAAVREEVGRKPPTTGAVVILTTMEVRRRLWLELRPELADISVLSYQELSPDVNIQPMSRITSDLKPYDEAFVAFIDRVAAPAGKEQRDRKVAAHGSASTQATIAVVERFRNEIIGATRADVSRKGLYLPSRKEAVDRFFHSLLTAFLQSASSQDSSIFDTLFEQWKMPYVSSGMMMSSLANLMLALQKQIRRVPARAEPPIELETFSHVVETIAAASDLAFERFVKNMTLAARR